MFPKQCMFFYLFPPGQCIQQVSQLVFKACHIIRVTHGNQEYIIYIHLSVDICDCHHRDRGFLNSLAQLVEGLYFRVLVCPRRPEGGREQAVQWSVLQLG